MSDPPAAQPARTAADGPPQLSNPFATRYVRPGMVPFVFADHENAAVLLARLESHDWWGQIVGPHGSGKSTLLALLIPQIAAAGRQPILITLHDAERSLAAHRGVLSGASAGAILIIDGYEQLWPWNRWWLRRFCRRRRLGLVVTTHRAMGLPPLLSTRVTPRVAAEVFRHLVPTSANVTLADLDTALQSHPDDLREALFELYDVFETRRLPGT